MAEIDASLKGQYVQANGLNIYYEKYGSGEPLVLLHGGTMTSKRFAPLIPALSEHFQVVAPDLRGHGQMVNPSGEFSYRRFVDIAMVDKLHLSLACTIRTKCVVWLSVQPGLGFRSLISKFYSRWAWNLRGKSSRKAQTRDATNGRILAILTLLEICPHV